MNISEITQSELKPIYQPTCDQIKSLLTSGTDTLSTPRLIIFTYVKVFSYLVYTGALEVGTSYHGLKKELNAGTNIFVFASNL